MSDAVDLLAGKGLRGVAIERMEWDHYPGIAEQSFSAIAEETAGHWPLQWFYPDMGYLS